VNPGIVGVGVVSNVPELVGLPAIAGGFVALATSESWPRELIDAELERWGYGIDPAERTAESLACH
jgi:hypothetical protein